MLGQILMDTCASADSITVPFFTLVMMHDSEVVYRSTVLREIVRLCGAPDPEDRQRGQQAAVTLVTLQTLPRMTVILDCDEPLAAHADDDLVLRARATNGTIYTADTGLQQRAETEGIAVLRVQDLHRRFRTMMPTLQEIFPPLCHIAIGETVTVRVHKLGRFDGEGTGVLEDGRQVVMRDALALFMEEYPAGGDRTVPHQLTAHDFLSDRYEAPLDMLLAETDSTERDALLSDMNEAVIKSILSDTNTDAPMVSATTEASVLYDPTKFVLGRLCKQGHDFDSQGHSLRYLKGDKDCVQCRQARSARNASKANKTRATRKARQGT